MREVVCCMQRRGVRALALQQQFANEGSHDRGNFELLLPLDALL